jgi:hypothetical protein
MNRSGTRHSWLPICGALVAISCASSVHSSERGASADGDAAGASADSTGGAIADAGAAGVIENGGASGTMAAAGAVDEPKMSGSDAGAPTISEESEPVAKRAHSGGRLCEVDLDCDEGLTCSSSTGRVNRACLARCESDADCKHDERCFAQDSIEKSCFRSCQESYTVCAYQFDCADYYRANQYLCLPTEWIRNWAQAPVPGS